MAEKIITVSQLSEYIGSVLLTDPILKRLYVKGEVSNCTYHSNGNVYFTLKDDNAAIKCIVFYDIAEQIDLRIEDGISVSVKGHLIHNKKDGSYSIAIKEIELEGSGKIYEEVELLKRRLQKEGLFDEAHKKSIPAHVNKLGVVTSATGAAIRDIINVASRRNKNIEIILSPAKVQGIGAEEEIINALLLLEEYADLDVIIIGRGGGSYEDLNAFNSEKLARMIYDCPIPTISAVGHEIDFTIADFVSDMRAPTPSSAAELAVEDIGTVKNRINRYEESIYRNTLKIIDNYNRHIASSCAKLHYFRPHNVLYREEKRVNRLSDSLYKAAAVYINQKNMRCSALKEKLDALSPLGVLKRGYAIIKDQDTGTLIKSAKDSRNSIQVFMQDGIINADVKKVQLNEGI